jgi:hypothetical protein
MTAIRIGIDVILRKVFETSIGGADERAGYALALDTTGLLDTALPGPGQEVIPT